MIRVIMILPYVTSFALFPFMSKGQSSFKKELHSRLVPISSINPDSGNDSDLAFLDTLLENKRIVMLGEQSFLHGSSRLAKVRIIDYLHEHLGYNVLLIENSFFETDRAWRDIVEKKDSAIGSFCYLTGGVASDIDCDNFFLARNLDRWLEKGNPLIVQGLDIAGYSFYHIAFRLELEELCYRLIPDFETDPLYKAFLYFTHKGKIKVFESEKEFTDWKASLNLDSIHIAEEALCNYLETIKIGSEDSLLKREISFFIQAIKSETAYFHQVVAGPGEYFRPLNADCYEIREKQMTDNLIWYLDEYFPGQKIITSTSTFHISRNLTEIDPRPDFLGSIEKTMADHIADRYKDQVYSVAFITYGGMEGISGFTEEYKIHDRKYNGFEGLMHKEGVPYGFLDLSCMEGENKIFTKPAWLFPSIGNEVRTDWSKIYDGLFFIDQMEILPTKNYQERASRLPPYSLPSEWYFRSQ